MTSLWESIYRILFALCFILSVLGGILLVFGGFIVMAMIIIRNLS